MILTPVARVAFSVFAFWQQRDQRYVDCAVDSCSRSSDDKVI
nr:DUF1634 domain-containing protein [Brasilonema octagenarum]